MKTRIFFLFFCWMALAGQLRAQDDKEPKAQLVDKTDIIAFHRQILTLKEYMDERAKIPSLQKANKVTVKVKAIVDSTVDMDAEEDAKATKLKGYIRQQIGDPSVNLSEITYDRTKKKITAVVPTGDTLDSAAAAVKAKKPEAKKAAPRKPKDEDDDADDEKSVKGKSKGKDADDDN